MNNNKYGSQVNTYVGVDMMNTLLSTYSNPPPADISIPLADFASAFLWNQESNNPPSQFAAFNKAEKPYVRGLGLFSNLADGLVFTPSGNFLTGISLFLNLIRMGAQSTGTIANVAGTNAVTGTGTLFTQEYFKGSLIWWFDDGNVPRFAKVLTVTDDTDIILTAVTASTGMFANNTSAASHYPQIAPDPTNGMNLVRLPILTLNTLQNYDLLFGDVSGVVPPMGVVTVVSGSAAVVGIGTSFLTQLGPGGPGMAIGYLDDTGTRRTGVIQSITDATHLTLTAVAIANATKKPLLFLDDHARISVRAGHDMNFSTISIDPAYAAKQFSISAMAAIETSTLPTAVNL